MSMRNISFPNPVLEKIIEEYCKEEAIILYESGLQFWSDDEIIGIILSRFYKTKNKEDK